MAEENEFIRQIKNHNKKLKINFFIRLGIVIFTYLLLIVYLFSPLSQIQNYELSGNIYLNEDDILNIAHLSRSDSLYTLNTSRIKELIDNHPLFPGNHTKVEVTPMSFKLEVKELALGATYDSIYYFNDGEIHDDVLKHELVKDFLNQYKELLPELAIAPSKIEKTTLIGLIEKTYLIKDDPSYLNLEYINIFEDSENLYSYYFSSSKTDNLIKVTIDPDESTSEEITGYLSEENVTNLCNNALAKEQKALEEKLGGNEKKVYSFVCSKSFDNPSLCSKWEGDE